jgi:hypothetical protein
MLLGLKEQGHPITDVLADGGYTLAKPEYFLQPLRDAGVHVTFKPGAHQRPPKPFSEDAIPLDGQLFSSAIPEELKELPMPPRDATEKERAKYIEAFERRAAYRYSLHAGPDPDGYTRWKGPFAAGRLRSRQLRETMRGSRDTPLVQLPEGARLAATITVSARDLPLRQDLTVGTGAWFTSYSRRNIVESVNGALKGDFVDMDEKFFRVTKDADAKITFLAAFTIAGYNNYEAEGFREQEALNGEKTSKKIRARRRKDTLRDILGTPGADSDERGPPGP